ncbi:hypothetical protein PHLCEN_2v11752 [Hermanssonia centrifuga]|uniref:RNA-dependent RNA polymerase n=1 Tax=Hermanssonia centrifuga TaxID=98765 RepID=A0A2R6NJ62_9APHY|nr:hypothetical protein PHLCEN_2v11752 [Hermanssonia centrifuga]
MEIFMRDLGFSATDTQLRISVAGVLHGPDYSHHRDTTLPINFAIYLHKRRGNVRQRTGVLTLPTVAIGNQFLQEFGGPTPRRSIVLGTKVDFRLSNKPPRPHIVEEIRRLPYDDPRAQEERDRQTDLVRSEVVSLRAIQFGWECRDNVFSIEWERIVDRCELIFDDERREFRIKAYEPSLVRFIAIRASHIAWTSAAMDTSTSTTPAIFLSLNYPPNYETESTRNISILMQALNLSSRNLEPEPRQRWTNFGNDHAEIAPYTSVAIRLLCRDQSGLKTYQRLCKFAHIKADEYAYPAERRNLFSSSVQAEYQSWLLQLAWPVAFQVEALTRGLLVDLREMLHLRRRILEMVRDKGATFTSSFLRHFATQAKTLFWYTDETYTPSGSVQDLYVRCEQDYSPPTRSRPRGPVPVPDIDIFECLHVTVTPTSMLLDGPYPERSNRIMRQYTGNHDSFLRVNFVDETQLQYRFDREVDGASFIKRRVGKVLTDGLHIAGRHFRFLAYSQSALKEHAVWFVKEFVHSDGKVVNAATIIEGLGTFDGLVSDPKLIYCPARYGARISQAFTATDSSVTVEPEEIFELDDIHDIAGKWCFTDGVGTISGDLAREIWRTLSARRRGARKAQTYPRAFQIRFMGSKGMLSVDYRLTGRAICIRPSMIKFEAPSSLAIDIARAFYRPGPFYLNRQLIMILEALGVPYEVFAKLQRAAVRDAQESVNSLERSARLLETYGLGTSYRLTSVMLSLHKLGVEPLSEDPFWQKMMDFSVNHVLRELKYHARIPVPEAWNLVGVADIHGYLTEGEIFGCIVPPDGTAPIYLEGPTTVSRSPSIHPGDVQIARGIGKPPPGSPFERESLRNTLVFSVKGILTCLDLEMY